MIVVADGPNLSKIGDIVKALENLERDNGGYATLLRSNEIAEAKKQREINRRST
ncbi:MAG: hypothetical protein WCA81_16515 [Rhizomicrobium sp.]